MSRLNIGDQLVQEIAGVALQRAARQYATVVEQVARGECSQDLLRARVASLAEAATTYAAAYGWQEPP